MPGHGVGIGKQPTAGESDAPDAGAAAEYSLASQEGSSTEFKVHVCNTGAGVEAEIAPI